MLPTTNRATSPISTPARQAAPITSRTRRCIAAYCTRRPSPMLRVIAAHCRRRALPPFARCRRMPRVAPGMCRPILGSRSNATFLANINGCSAGWEVETVWGRIGEPGRFLVHKSGARASKRARNQSESRPNTTRADIRQVWPHAQPPGRWSAEVRSPGRGSTRGPAAQSGPRNNVRGPAARWRRGLVGPALVFPSSRAGSANQPSGRPPPRAVANPQARNRSGLHLRRRDRPNCCVDLRGRFGRIRTHERAPNEASAID